MTRAEYATALALATGPVVAAVHRGEDPEPHIRSALTLTSPDDVNPVVALITVLAARVDPDTDIDDQLAWAVAFDPDVIAACGKENLA